MAAKKPAAKPKPAAAKPVAAVKGPVTKSGTLSAADRKPELAPPVPVSKPARKPKPAAVVEALSPELGPGFVEHGVGVGRHRVEDGLVPAPGTVVLVPPERGQL